MPTTQSSTKGNKYSCSNPKIKSNRDQSARVIGLQNPKDKKLRAERKFARSTNFSINQYENNMKHPVTADNALRYCRYLVSFLFSMPFRLQSPARAWQLDRQSESKRSRQPIHKIKEGSGTGSVLPRLRMTHWGRPNCICRQSTIPSPVQLVSAAQPSVTLPLKIYYHFGKRIWILCIRYIQLFVHKYSLSKFLWKFLPLISQKRV